MFSKILVANRGEIACRIMKTARYMNIATVAVYSEADQHMLHVRLADESVDIGPSPAKESYLNIDKIIDACKQTGAEAVHPGYGFLSENAEFAKRLKESGLVFIGPDTKAIYAMGDKIESKRIAKQANVSVIPGFVGVVEDEEQAKQIAQEIGYPVMVKASAGGGGKGMRTAFNDEELVSGFHSARNEAASSFADNRILLEKFIQQPRHIEIQIIADSFGSILYLWERDCSIQRRHQKVIEEAPSTFLSAKVRREMGEQAIALAKAVHYQSAGTVEFIVDHNAQFYFLEMNTRLQVEHPVTEMITGLDLVELMIRVAAGEPLPLQQKDVRMKGWALEARIYAEDPTRNFLPSIGRITRYHPPLADQNIQIHTGIYEGAEISIYYDPMIAKLCTYGIDRQTAITTMQNALDAFQIRGITHNIAFLSALVRHPRFLSGSFSTNFIAEEFPEGFTSITPDPTRQQLLYSVAAFVHHRIHARNTQITGQMVGYEQRPQNYWVIRHEQENTPLLISDEGHTVQVRMKGHLSLLETSWDLIDSLWVGKIDGLHLVVQIDIHPNRYTYTLYHAGITLTVQVLTRRFAELYDFMPVRKEQDRSKFLLSPMPGLVVALRVQEGQQVYVGQELCIIEAMKMENILRAEREATVKKIVVEPGSSVVFDEIIMEFD